MKTTNTNTNAIRTYTVRIDGETFANVTAQELAFIRCEYADTHTEFTMLGKHCFMRNERFTEMEREAAKAESAFESECAELSDVAANVSDVIEAEQANAPVASRISIAKNDTPWNMGADELANKYGVRKLRVSCTFTPETVAGIPSAPNGEQTRKLTYQSIETGAYYAQYNGEFWAIPESALHQANGDVKVSHIEASPKVEQPKKQANREKWACFNHGETFIVRKVHYNDSGERYVNIGSEKVAVSSLNTVSFHTREKAYARAEKERENMKRAEKNEQKREQAKQAKQETEQAHESGKASHIPETYNGVLVDVQNANLANVDTARKWEKVSAYADDIAAQGIELAMIVYERDFAWIYPIDRSEEFARKNHAVVNFASGRGHSLKENRRAWFVDTNR